jgi:hypothetical protein
LQHYHSGLFLQSAPGRLKGEFDFDIECQVLDKHLGKEIQMRQIDNPTLEMIKAEVTSDPNEPPAVIHLSGMDAFQGMTLLDPERKNPVSLIRDGVYLRDDQYNEHAVDSFLLAGAINAAALRPRIASFNFYNSSARTAAFAVALGADSAIGFQDLVDDLVAEVFFANYYLYWKDCNRDPLIAFHRAMASLAPYADKMQGTGIVLWRSQRVTPVPPQFYAAWEPPLTIEPNPPPLRDWVRPDIDPREKLNYSILHNDRKPLFREFSIYRLEPRPLQDLEIEVELQIGSERFPYRRTIELRDHVWDLSGQIGVGLTSRLARSLQEAVRATLMVRVGKPDATLVSETYQVSLLPVNEWRDDDMSCKWLPSFVLPRDPAVLKVIVAAQRYLMAFEDDANAGFDGYQSVDANSANPSENVDAQVRAIWCALLHDIKLNYINPPPTFSLQSQRLRTPSKTTEGLRGTCIDLALLIAACLEYIGVYPVIFLLKGHAFPGYWSNELHREEFLTVPEEAFEEGDEVDEDISSYSQTIPWMFDPSRFEEVARCVKDGYIVPLESTLLTSRGGFWEAIDEGIRNLEDSEAFEWMLDIKLARDADVTPLPLAEFDGN